MADTVMTPTRHLPTVLILLKRQQARRHSAIKRLEGLASQALNQSSIKRVTALRDQTQSELIQPCPKLIEAFDALLQALESGDSDRIETAYGDLVLANGLVTNADDALLKASPLWRNQVLDPFGQVRKEYKSRFREQFESEKKLTVTEQTQLLHQVIERVVDVDDPRGLKALSRSELKKRFPYQDVDELMVGIHGNDEDVVRFQQHKQTLNRLQAPAESNDQPRTIRDKLKRFFIRDGKQSANVTDLDDDRD